MFMVKNAFLRNYKLIKFDINAKNVINFSFSDRNIPLAREKITEFSIIGDKQLFLTNFRMLPFQSFVLESLAVITGTSSHAGALCA